MNAIPSVLLHTCHQVLVSLQHNWPYLALSIVAAVLLKVSLDPDKVSRWLSRHRRAGIVGATLAAVLTPLCSCGTTAVVLGMVAGTMPWAPIIAFMVASPLTSPGELIYSAGLFGWPFASAFFAASILLGLLGGSLASVLERRGWLAHQARFTVPPVRGGEESSPGPVTACGADEGGPGPGRIRTLATSLWRQFATSWSMAAAIGYAPYPIEWPAPVLPLAAPATACCGPAEGSARAGAAPLTEACVACGPASGPEQRAACGGAAARPATAPRVTVRRLLAETTAVGPRLLLWFVGFAFIGYFLNGLIPATWVSTLFGAGRIHGVPLAATLGLPLYVNSEASLPLVRTMLESGMSEGAALAFLITGAGTSIGAIAGALTIARWRVVGLVVATLWVGALATGYGFDLWQTVVHAVP